MRVCECVVLCSSLCTGSGMTRTLCGVMCGHISMTSSIHSSQSVQESSSPKPMFLNLGEQSGYLSLPVVHSTPSKPVSLPSFHYSGLEPVIQSVSSLVRELYFSIFLYCLCVVSGLGCTANTLSSIRCVRWQMKSLLASDSRISVFPNTSNFWSRYTSTLSYNTSMRSQYTCTCTLVVVA